MAAITTMKMKTSKPRQHRTKAMISARLLAGSILLASCAPFALNRAAYAAPSAAVPAQRSVQGRVVDKQDAAIVGAVVYLKDTRSLSVKSYLTDDEGHFHFGQLADGADYEIWAEQNGKRSSSKNISQFNSKLDIQFTLKIDLSK